MTPDHTRTVPDRRRRRLQAGAGLLTIGLLLGACGGAFDPEQARLEKIAEQTRRSYEGSLKRLRPAYVLVTYPGTIGSMREVKRRELDILRRVLDDLAIPHEVIDRNVVREKVTMGKNPEQVSVYNLPERVAAKVSSGTVIFLNLDVQILLRSVRHKDLAATGLKVMVWDDPIQVGASSRPKM